MMIWGSSISKKQNRIVSLVNISRSPVKGQTNNPILILILITSSTRTINSWKTRNANWLMIIRTSNLMNRISKNTIQWKIHLMMDTRNSKMIKQKVHHSLLKSMIMIHGMKMHDYIFIFLIINILIKFRLIFIGYCSIWQWFCSISLVI